MTVTFAGDSGDLILAWLSGEVFQGERWQAFGTLGNIALKINLNTWSAGREGD